MVGVSTTLQNFSGLPHKQNTEHWKKQRKFLSFVLGLLYVKIWNAKALKREEMRVSEFRQVAPALRNRWWLVVTQTAQSGSKWKRKKIAIEQQKRRCRSSIYRCEKYAVQFLARRLQLLFCALRGERVHS